MRDDEIRALERRTAVDPSARPAWRRELLRAGRGAEAGVEVGDVFLGSRPKHRLRVTGLSERGGRVELFCLESFFCKSATCPLRPSRSARGTLDRVNRGSKRLGTLVEVADPANFRELELAGVGRVRPWWISSVASCLAATWCFGASSAETLRLLETVTANSGAAAPPGWKLGFWETVRDLTGLDGPPASDRAENPE